MKIYLEIKDVFVDYRDSTKEWTVCVNIKTNNTYVSITFPNKKKNKAKKQFYKFMISGVLGEEMRYLFTMNKIRIRDREKGC